jgi:hypothetical protein
MRAAYFKTNGQAHDVRFVPDEYVLQAGEIEIDAEELPTAASLSDPLPPKADVRGFINALKAGQGGIVNANKLARAYPLFYSALENGAFDDVQALIIDAHTTAVLTDAQYASFKQAAAANYIPITLP